MFKKVMVPTDGSATALRAAETIAETIGAESNAEVTLVLAIAPLHSEDTDYDEEIVARHNTSMRDRAEATLKTTSQVFHRHGIACTVKVIEGDPVSAALAGEAEQNGYDLIAMGSRGMGMQKSDLHYLGSVTEHVIRRVGIPVLVVPVHREN
ncbi:MAG: universal stress protein [Capsulimonadaceae bacterium]